MNNIRYQNPMEPWSALAKYAKEITLGKNQLRIFYFEAGQNNTNDIILLHGLGDEADTWRYIIEPLAEKYHVFALDLPGFGRSDKPDHDYTPQFFFSTLSNFMKDLSIKKPILMGSSLGAILSQGFALKNKDKVLGLILLGGALIQETPMRDLGLKLMQVPLLGEWLYTRLRKDPVGAYNSIRNVYHDLDAMPKEDREFLYERVNKRVWSEGQRRAYFSTLRNMTSWVKQSQKGLKECLHKDNLPTLVIRGEFDPLFSEENADAIIEAQHKAAKMTINNAGHLPQQEAPQDVLNAVLIWLEKLDRNN